MCIYIVIFLSVFALLMFLYFWHEIGGKALMRAEVKFHPIMLLK